MQKGEKKIKVRKERNRDRLTHLIKAGDRDVVGVASKGGRE